MAGLFVKSGGTIRTATHAWIKSGGTWRDCQKVFVRVSGVWQQVFSLTSLVYTAITGSSTRNTTASGAMIATLTVNRDGTWALTTNGSGSTISPSGTQTWLTPNAFDSGDTRWIKVNVSGASLNAGSAAVSTVLALTTTRTFFQSAPTSGDSFTSTLTVLIYGDAAGTNLLSTGTVTLSVTKG